MGVRGTRAELTVGANVVDFGAEMSRRARHRFQDPTPISPLHDTEHNCSLSQVCSLFHRRTSLLAAALRVTRAALIQRHGDFGIA
jgi:hypothetical protein